MTRSVYIVYFETGRGRSFRQIVVKLFSTIKKARDFVSEKEKFLNEAGLNGKKGGDNSKIKDNGYVTSPKIIKRFGFIDFNGAWYAINGPYEVG